MSKSKNKSFRREWYDEDAEDYGQSDNKQKRKEKRLKNLIRAKNVDQMMDMEEEDYQTYRKYR